ncbi:helix-turn-helix domain-containing protein [Hydrogenophaga sp. 5NK40-0174]|uniref:helix-turn-helix domain-containing protein n=1 Tax=Hydrogenophaga sp. 5NK40-0174 TaxID=3127649 RepID=UPI00310A533C
MTEAQARLGEMEFEPDWVSPPGDTIVDLLEERDWTQQQLADRLGYSVKHVNQLIKAKVPLTEDAAIRLQRVFGSTVGFWLTREAQYRERVAIQEAEKQREAMVPWLERFPIREMMAAGELTRCRLDARTKLAVVDELLTFFSVATPEQWAAQYERMELSFRRSREDQADIAAISAWLRMGERLAERLDGPPFVESRFKAALNAIRSLTCQSPQEFEPRMKQLLHEAGVAFVLVPALPKAHVSGVARWLNPHRPMIQLSLYGKQNDRFWFSFFHEAAHILLHGKQKKSVFLDDPSKSGASSKEEQEANAWARDFLVSPESARFLPHLPKTKSAVAQFANSIGIHPGIVVGRMQHDGLLDVRWLNDLKAKFEFRVAR